MPDGLKIWLAIAGVAAIAMFTFGPELGVLERHLSLFGMVVFLFVCGVAFLVWRSFFPSRLAHGHGPAGCGGNGLVRGRAFYKTTITSSGNSTDPEFPHDPNPDNPNRCMHCMTQPDALKAYRYVPASDWILYDTNICGGCGRFDDVCDPTLFDIYRREGLELSAIGIDDSSDACQLVRLRIRADKWSGVDYRNPALITEFTLQDAVNSARAYKASRKIRSDRAVVHEQKLTPERSETSEKNNE